MNSQSYQIPPGLHAVAAHLLDTRSDAEVDSDLLHPPPVRDEKNVWFFWDSGYQTMHAYTKRNIRAWHRRLSKKGWVVRVLDRVSDSPLNIAKFLDVFDPETFPRAFSEGTISGDYAPQHTSDLVRWPLLLKYGGVYADVGLMQIGDLDRLWCETIGNPASPYEVVSYNEDGEANLFNYFLASGRNNRLFGRCHRLLLALWAEDGGKTSTEGMHESSLLAGTPLMGGDFTIDDEQGHIGAAEVSKMLTDYIIQGHVITKVMAHVDEDEGWNGPKYAAQHVYGIAFMEGSQLINIFTEWNGRMAFDLMSLRLPQEGETESAEQRRAREIVQACLQKSFGFKLAHGLILRVFKETLGSLWRKHEGSDNVPGTYAHWLRHATTYWNQDEIPPPVEIMYSAAATI